MAGMRKGLMNLLGQITRLPFVLGLWHKFPVGSVATRVAHGIFPYPHYAYGAYWSAVLASRLKIPRISVLEFGVAGGRGLLALERVSAQIEKAVGVGIDVVGFDSGQGMPAPSDYRDLPHIWGRGFYKMDQDKLRAKLKRAKLVLGDVGQTVPDWIENGQQAPIGFIAFDLDYYSSTRAALQVLQGPATCHLPRVHCFFDDVASNDLGCMNPYVGELLAIKEFNESFPDRKVCKIELLRLARPRWEHWQEKMYAFHNFTHPEYNTLVVPRTQDETQLPL
jgi:hypothetical protein